MVIVKSDEFKAECDRDIAVLTAKIAATEIRNDLGAEVRDGIIGDYSFEIRQLEEAKLDEVIDEPINGYEVEEW